jgi:protocatechuate 3,4-dioxygenase beta subunit
MSNDALADLGRSVLDRRRLIALGGTALLAACSRSSGGSGDATASGSTAAGSTESSPTGTVPPSTAATATDIATAFTAADFDTLGTCVLLPEKTSGPFPLDEQFARRDITEDHPGHPLRLGFRVIDDACTPLPGATVELWHCDATGDYSAFTDGGGGKDEGSGTTFLRGSQTAADDGIVEFLTVVPGWYRGRAVHIHLRVHLDDATVLTSQLFFDAGQLAAIYSEEAYADNGLPDTSNEQDGIAGDPEAEGTLLALAAGATTRGEGSVALLNLGVDPAATSTGGGGGGGPRP